MLNPPFALPNTKVVLSLPDSLGASDKGSKGSQGRVYMRPKALPSCGVPEAQAVRIVDVPLPLSSSSRAAFEHDSGEAAEVALPPAVSAAIHGMGLQRSAGLIQLVQQQVGLTGV